MFRFVFLSILIVLFLVFNLFTSTIGRRIFICPEEDIETGCKDPKMCIYSDPNDCNGFIQCNDAGEVFYQKCNIGLEWNDFIKNCDEPKRSTCDRM